MKSLSSSILSTFFALTISGCASLVDTNKVVELPAPTIGVTDSTAEVQIMEPISGTGCAGTILGVFKTGAQVFRNTSGDEPGSAFDRAKSAATYNAIRGTKKTELNTDMLVNPVYSIATKDPFGLSFLVHDVCVNVSGNRAVVKGYKPAETITRPVAAGSSEDKGWSPVKIVDYVRSFFK